MMINRRLFLGGSASAAALAVLAACAKTDSGESSGGGASGFNPQDRSALKQGGELRFSITSTIANWNRSTVDGNSVNLDNIYAFVMPYAVLWTEDGSPSPNPNFFTTLEAEDAGGKTVVTATVNDKAVWGNGRPMDSEDIRESLIHGTDENYAWASTDNYDQIEKIDIVDKLTAKITFKTIFPDWTNMVASLAPKELMAKADTFNKSMAGNGAFNNDYFAGPFKIDSYDESQQLVTLVPNDKWWGDAPLLDKVTFRVLDSAAEATSFANSAIDVISYIISADVYNQASGRSDAEIRQNVGRQWRHFTINASSGPLAEEPVRQAILRACDREAIAASDLAGLPVEVDKLLLGNRFFLTVQEGYQDNSGDWSHDPEAAKKLLDEAGWKEGSDGIRVKNGQRLTFAFTLPSGTPTSENEGNLLQSQLKDVGIEMTMQTVETNKYFTDYVNPKNYGITAFTWQKTQYPMANIKQIYGTGSESNFTGQSVPEIDSYIVKISTTNDAQERYRMTNEVDKLVWQHVMNIPIYERRELTAVPKNLANYGAMGLSSVYAENIGYMAD
ncbi:ABC transporter family substrate-binding protein [Actinomyces israelii]|uniref:ABC transporter family substrate-binding protein n=1 Tax=Actinomyces israelii TaxID=1659 RepID=UPI0005B98C20|nr:ABC transporter substrate-binding protein [Actinomyces israelii]